MDRIEFTGRPMRKNGGPVGIEILRIKSIKLSRNSRHDITDDQLIGLMSSIKEEGLLEPIGVVKQGAAYEVCYGNRRFLACSKLGYHEIPAIVHETKDARDIDMKNLTENIQRRNLTLQEAGRYMHNLMAEGLTIDQISIRLGVSDTYVSQCLNAFEYIPKEFRKDLDIRVSGNLNSQKPPPGKISINTATKIINSEKQGHISKPQMRALLKEARDNPAFKGSHIESYVKSIARGGSVSTALKDGNYRIITLSFCISHKEYDNILDKHCGDNGPFKSVQAFLKAVLTGEKSYALKILDKKV